MNMYIQVLIIECVIRDGLSSFFMDLLILYNQSVLCASLQNVCNSAFIEEFFLRITEFEEPVH